MRQAIVTKYHGPTNTRGARVSATAQAGRIYVEWEDGLGIEANHAAAAEAFARKFDWFGRWVQGGLPDGSHVHVRREFADAKESLRFYAKERIISE